MSQALTKRVRYGDNQRIDLDEKLAEDTLLDASLLEYFKGLIVDGPDGRIFKGFVTSTTTGANVGFDIDAPTPDGAFAIDREGNLLIMDGSSGLAVALTTNAINYIHGFFEEVESDNDSRRFFDIGSQLEITASTDTRFTRTVNLHVTTTAFGGGVSSFSDFATSALISGKTRQLIPLYALPVNVSDDVTAVDDFRPMFAPAIEGEDGNKYDLEATVRDLPFNFSPTDGPTIGITSMRTGLVAIADRLKQLKGTANWFTDSTEDIETISAKWDIVGASNLNRASGNVGIGIPTPLVKLHVLNQSRTEGSSLQFAQLQSRIAALSGTATSSNLIAHYDEGDKQFFNFDAIHDESGTPAGTLGFAWRVGALSSPTQIMELLETSLTVRNFTHITRESNVSADNVLLVQRTSTIGTGEHVLLCLRRTTTVDLNDNDAGIVLDFEFEDDDFGPDAVARIIVTTDGADDAAKMEFKTQPTGGVTTTAIRIDSDQFVAIGDFDPAARLHVDDVIRVRGNDDQFVSMHSRDATQPGGLGGTNNNVIGHSADGTRKVLFIDCLHAGVTPNDRSGMGIRFRLGPGTGVPDEIWRMEPDGNLVPRLGTAPISGQDLGSSARWLADVWAEGLYGTRDLQVPTTQDELVQRHAQNAIVACAVFQGQGTSAPIGPNGDHWNFTTTTGRTTAGLYTFNLDIAVDGTSCATLITLQTLGATGKTVNGRIVNTNPGSVVSVAIEQTSNGAASDLAINETISIMIVGRPSTLPS